MAEKIPLKLVDLGSGAGELREFATTDTIPTSNLNATTSATDTTSGRVWRTNDLVKTTSAIDTTAGSMLKVGDFGLGSIVTPVIANIDAFSTPSGFYKFTNGAGTKPVGGGAYAYVLINNWNGVTLNQTWIPYGTPQMFVRTATGNNTWGAWVEVATSVNSLGHGQTWQNVTASRALGTTYTNTTGRPIEVVVQTTSASGVVAVVVVVNGVDASFTQTSGGGGYVSATATVPIGATYSGTNNIVGGVTLYQWVELR